MYNLKKIYGVISFEFESVRLLIVEKNNEKTNLIYFDEIKEPYYDKENAVFFNEKETLSKLLIMIKNADNFVGNQIKRYVINNSLLDLRVVENESPTFLVFDQTLTTKNLKNYLSKINFLDTKTDEIIVKIQPVEWRLDGKSFPDFPLGEIGSNLRFRYLAYVGKRSLIYQFANLIESLKILPLTQTSNEIAFSGLIKNQTEKNENCVVINVSYHKLTINFYEKTRLVKILSYAYGTKKIEQEIKNKFGINKDANIRPLLKTLKYFDKKSNDVVMVNIHLSNFLSVKEGTNKHLLSLIEIIFKKIIKDTMREVELRSKETNVSYGKILLHIDDCVLCDICKSLDLKFNDLENVSFLENKTIGLSDENVVNLIGSIETAILEQEANREIVYSIDVFVSQDVFNQQAKKQIVLKLGMLSTEWSAKLGE